MKFADDVDLRRVAALTPGMAGADLANLINEAALLAARRNKDAVTPSELNEAIERGVAGLEKKNRLMNSREKEIVAHHESGHALLAEILPTTDRVHKVSMIPRGLGALGYTMQLPLEDRYLMTRPELLDKITVLMGGRAAEKVVFNEVSTGATDDLQRATDLARRMVSQFGMSAVLGPQSVDHLGDGASQRFLQAPQLLGERGYSERTQQTHRSGSERAAAARVRSRGGAARAQSHAAVGAGGAAAREGSDRRRGAARRRSKGPRRRRRCKGPTSSSGRSCRTDGRSWNGACSTVHAHARRGRREPAEARAGSRGGDDRDDPHDRAAGGGTGVRRSADAGAGGACGERP